MNKDNCFQKDYLEEIERAINRLIKLKEKVEELDFSNAVFVHVMLIELSLIFLPLNKIKHSIEVLVKKLEQPSN